MSRDPTSRKWLAGALGLALWGCLELDAERPECFPDEACPSQGLCVQGRCQAGPEPLSVSLARLGAEGSACRALLFSRVPQAICLTVGGQVLSLPFEGEALTGEDGQALTVAAGLTADPGEAALFFLTRPCDDQLTPDTACTTTEGCLMALRQSAFQAPGAGPAELRFSETVWPVGTAPEERCDDQDQDCDGTADEGLGLGEVCTAGLGVCAREGQTACSPSGEVGCSAEPGEPGVERKDELDNDCDGEVDEGLGDECKLGDVVPCNVERGICHVGTQNCNEFGFLEDCLDERGAATVAPGTRPELCNGEDDDCDGTSDEGFSLPDGTPVGQTCHIGIGTCAASGRVRCVEGRAACDAVAGTASDERCNALDDDCDGETDEGFVGIGETCYQGVGQCAATGHQVCAPDGLSVICDAVVGPVAEERCNALDDDCDGEIDEDFALGERCTAGVGACAASGTLACDPADPTGTRCVARLGEPAMERCNAIDDDCDGQTDEDFDLIRDAANCGACGNRCALAHAIAACADRVCVISRCDGGYLDADQSPENGCECNAGALDLPDPDFTDVNCDGLDGDLRTAIFVSSNAGNDETGRGTHNAPFRTLERAVTVANMLKSPIYLDEGVYSFAETLRLKDISLHGGYRYAPEAHTWERAAYTEHRTELRGPAIALHFYELSQTTWLDNLIVTSADATEPGGASIAVLATDTLDLLNVRGCVLASGRGASGADGHSALAGASAPAGEAGDREGSGGAGAINAQCDSGRGGDGGALEVSGADGEGLVPGTGGGSVQGAAGEDGLPGGDGLAAVATPPANPNGALAADQLWRPLSSHDGAQGGPGSGGGGGGGAWPDREFVPFGGGGGGGGAGGCGGMGAKGAQGGGGSFALYVFDGVVSLLDSQLLPGAGGGGGVGGSGGLGGDGSLGGRGGRPLEGLAGGTGGEGGAGGCGGHTGGGPGGPSFALFLAFPEQSGARFFDLRGQLLDQRAGAVASLTPGQGGPGGQGGAPQSRECNPSDPGADGLSGLIGCCDEPLRCDLLLCEVAP